MRKVVLFVIMVAMLMGAAPARADVTDITNAATELPAALLSNTLLQAQAVIDYGTYLSTAPDYFCSPPAGHHVDTTTAVDITPWPTPVLKAYETAAMTATCSTIYPDSFPMTTRISFEYVDQWGNWHGVGNPLTVGCTVPVTYKQGVTTETEACAGLVGVPAGDASLNHWHHAVYQITEPISPPPTYSDIYFVADAGRVGDP